MSTRVALRLGLGIVCGIVLVLLPAAFSTVASPSEPSVYGQSARTVPNPSMSSSQSLLGLRNPGTGGVSFLVIIFVIFLPSTLFSLAIRRWAERRARDYL